jgi:hypothetical protein
VDAPDNLPPSPGRADFSPAVGPLLARGFFVGGWGDSAAVLFWPLAPNEEAQTRGAVSGPSGRVALAGGRPARPAIFGS